ncbi:MAG: TatD family hydrolase [Pseudomonadota bacterium]|nr:TatD family hydrolase [Pseudomonadota bacterium]
MFDIGVNLDHTSYLEDLSKFEQEYLEEGVEGIICIASNLEEAHKLTDLCSTYQSMHFTLGCHPHYASTWTDSHQAELISLFKHHKKAIAVGEMGLDFNRNYSSPSEQITAFEAQLELANIVKRPAYLHERDAFDELTLRLGNTPLDHGGVIHCFTGDTQQLKAYLDLGLMVGITGWLLDERRNQSLVEALQYLPLDRLLIETDAPYLLPRTIRPRPKRNHPKYLNYIAEAVAHHKQTNLETVKEITAANTRQLFLTDGL